MATPSAPGPQTPAKYPVQVGPKYLYWGEQPGWIYNPYTDTYEPDPKVAKDWAIQSGLQQPDPKPPGLVDQLLPVAGVAGAAYGGKKAGEYIVDKVPGLFGGESGVAQAQAPNVVSASRVPAAGAEALATAATPTTQAAPGLMGAGEAPNVISTSRAPMDTSTGGWLGAPEWLASGDPFAGEAAGALPYAGAALGAYGLYNTVAEPSKNPLSGAAKGAASGAAVGSVIPGVGTAIGAVVGGTIGAASSLFGYHESGREQIQKRISGLENRGVSLPQFVKALPSDYGLSKEELVQREQKKFDMSNGAIGNPTFAASRDEKDLRYTDTWGGLPWFETFGNDYLGRFTEDQRKRMNELALAEGLIKEGNGQLTFTDEERVKQIADEVIGSEAISQGERSSTLSPGIGLDGKPVSYSNRGMM